MENNQVTLNLKDYNKLRDFKTEIEKGNTLHSWESNTWGDGYVWVTADEAVKCIINENKNAAKEIKKLKEQIWDLKHPESKKITIKDIEKMSVWEFIKWRRK